MQVVVFRVFVIVVVTTVMMMIIIMIIIIIVMLINPNVCLAQSFSWLHIIMSELSKLLSIGYC